MTTPDAASWPADPAVLRAEIAAMLEALVGALDARLPAADLRGLYFKGSASRVWTAPCDYVPELSDLDLHVWLRDDAAAGIEAQFRDSRFALAFAADAEAAFLARVPRPLHVPRPQVLLLNEAMRHAPVWSLSAATVLRGEPYPGTGPTPREDRDTLLAVSADAAGLGLSVMDKLGPQVWTALRAVHWRVSPLAARLLGASGAGAWVWGEPRSALLPELRARAFADVADALDAYFRSAWDAFASGWQDAAAMRAAVSAGLDALALAAVWAGRMP